MQKRDHCTSPQDKPSKTREPWIWAILPEEYLQHRPPAAMPMLRACHVFLCAHQFLRWAKPHTGIFQEDPITLALTGL